MVRDSARKYGIPIMKLEKNIADSWGGCDIESSAYNSTNLNQYDPLTVEALKNTISPLSFGFPVSPIGDLKRESFEKITLTELDQKNVNKPIRIVSGTEIKNTEPLTETPASSNDFIKIPIKLDSQWCLSNLPTNQNSTSDDIEKKCIHAKNKDGGLREIPGHLLIDPEHMTIIDDSQISLETITRNYEKCSRYSNSLESNPLKSTVALLKLTDQAAGELHFFPYYEFEQWNGSPLILKYVLAKLKCDTNSVDCIGFSNADSGYSWFLSQLKVKEGLEKFSNKLNQNDHYKNIFVCVEF